MCFSGVLVVDEGELTIIAVSTGSIVWVIVSVEVVFLIFSSRIVIGITAGTVLEVFQIIRGLTISKFYKEMNFSAF